MGKEEVQTIQWVKKMYRQYNGYRRGTDNTMGNVRTKDQTTI